MLDTVPPSRSRAEVLQRFRVLDIRDGGICHGLIAAAPVA